MTRRNEQEQGGISTRVLIALLVLAVAGSAAVLFDPVELGGSQETRSSAQVIPNHPVEPVIPAVTAGETRDLKRRLRREILGGIPKRAQASISVRSLSTGRELWSHQKDLALVPASNTKIFTASAILEALGPDHRFETRFLATTPVVNGVLKGDLVVVGAGDPTLSFRFVEGPALNSLLGVVGLLKKDGLERIEGRILGDNRLFQGPVTGQRWPKDPGWRWWMVEVNPLVFNDNRVEFTCSGKGGKPVVSPDPDVGYVRVVNRLKLAQKSGDQNIQLTRPEGSNVFTLSGRVWKDTGAYSVIANIHDGDRYFVTSLKRALVQSGIPVGGEPGLLAQTVDLAELHPVFTYSSTLGDSLPKMLAVSQNLYAEIYLLLLGVAKNGEGSFASGNRALLSWLDKLGIRHRNTTLSDGSGLSRANRVSSAQVADLLVYMGGRSRQAVFFMNSLARPGEDGTLRRRLKDLAGRVQAKTGTLNSISALSGYVKATSGRQFVFSCLFNSCDVTIARQLQDKLCRIIHAEL